MAVPQEKIVKVKVLTLFYYSRTLCDTRMREKSFLKNVYVNKFLSVA